MFKEAQHIYEYFKSIAEPCKPWQLYQDISIVGDRQIKYRAHISPCSYAVAFPVDGNNGLLPDCSGNRKCDKIFLIKRPDGLCHACFLEMKSGRDIAHAVSQLIATLNDSLFNSEDFRVREGIVVHGSSIPKSRPGGDWARLQRNFMSQTQCNLRKVRHNCPDYIKL